MAIRAGWMRLLSIAVIFCGFACGHHSSGPVLELRADGSILEAGHQLWTPHASDSRPLIERVQALALAMPRELAIKDNPGGPSFPSGRLELRIDVECPAASLAQVTDACLRTRISKLTLVPVRSGIEQERIRFRLTRDAGIVFCSDALDAHPVEVRIQTNEGELEFTLAVPTDWASEEHTSYADVVYDERRVHGLVELERALSAQFVANPDRLVELKPPNALPFGKLLEVVHVAVSAGHAKARFAEGWLDD